MPWAQIDDNMLDCPKAIEAGPEATDLLLRAIVWCSRHMTDGRIPKAALGTVSGGSRRALVRMMRLVKCGWVADSGDHFLIVDYLDWNRSKAQILEAREKDKARKPKGFRGGSEKESERNPSGAQPESTTQSERNPELVQTSSPLPASPLLFPSPTPSTAGAPAPAPPLALEAEPERKQRVPKERVLPPITEEVRAILGSKWPDASFDEMTRRLSSGDLTPDDVLAIARYAKTDTFWGNTGPSTIYRKKHWPDLLGKARSAKMLAPARDGTERRVYTREDALGIE